MKPLKVFHLYGEPDGQDYLGQLLAASAAEAEAFGSRIFEGVVIAVEEGEPPPHRLPFSGPPPFVCPRAL